MGNIISFFMVIVNRIISFGILAELPFFFVDTNHYILVNILFLLDFC